MTRSLLRCAHIARTDAPRIRGIRDLVPDDARLPGMPGLHFRVIANRITREWHDGQDTANAVGW